jgi:hypothetical protein
MIRSLKLFGLVLLAAFAMSAAVASTTTASQFTTTPLATLAGTEKTQFRFVATGLSISCSEGSFHATAFGSSLEALRLGPRLTGCKTSLGTAATITGFGHLSSEAEKPKCQYAFYSTGLIDLECEEGGEVTIDAGTCVIHISQHTLSAGGVGYTNTSEEGVTDILMNIETTSTATHTDGFLCPMTSSGEGTLVMEGEVTVEASVGGEKVSISRDP